MKKTVLLLFLSIVLLGCGTQAEPVEIDCTQEIPFDHPDIMVLGRYLLEEEGLVYSWPSVALEFRFEGGAFDIFIDSRNGQEIWYELQIDDRDPIKCKISSRRGLIQSPRDLAWGDHQVRLVRINEYFAGISRFRGIALEEDSTLLANQTPMDRRIEFIGDSLTCGFGSQSFDVNDPFELEAENSEQTYAALAAKSLGAQYMVTAISGRGVYRNCDDSIEGILPRTYDLALHQYDATWAFDSWQPQLVVINLGANDFGTSIPEEELFVSAYVDFILQIIDRNSTVPEFLCIVGPTFSNDWPIDEETGKPIESLNIIKGYLEEVQRRLEENHSLSIHLGELSQLRDDSNWGAAWHPNVRQHRINARDLEEQIREIMGW